MPERVPDAVAALVAAVIEDNPFAPPHRQAALVVRALRRDGWVVFAPSGRSTTDAVADLADSKSTKLLGR